MSEWHCYAPLFGWAGFTESEALTAALWEQFAPADWQYVNFTSDSSAWESRRDGSMVLVMYVGDRVPELATQGSLSKRAVEVLSTRFNLVAENESA